MISLSRIKRWVSGQGDRYSEIDASVQSKIEYAWREKRGVGGEEGERKDRNGRMGKVRSPEQFCECLVSANVHQIRATLALQHGGCDVGPSGGGCGKGLE